MTRFAPIDPVRRLLARIVRHGQAVNDHHRAEHHRPPPSSSPDGVCSDVVATSRRISAAEEASRGISNAAAAREVRTVAPADPSNAVSPAWLRRLSGARARPPSQPCHRHRPTEPSGGPARSLNSELATSGSPLYARASNPPTARGVTRWHHRRSTATTRTWSGPATAVRRATDSGRALFDPDAVWHAQRLGRLGGDHRGYNNRPEVLRRLDGADREPSGSTSRRSPGQRHRRVVLLLPLRTVVAQTAGSAISGIPCSVPRAPG